MNEDIVTSVIFDQINPVADKVTTSERRSHARIIMKTRPENRCGTCKHALIYTQKSSNAMSVFCRNIERFVPPDVETCNAYLPLGNIELWDLAKMAKIVDRPVDEGGHYF